MQSPENLLAPSAGLMTFTLVAIVVAAAVPIYFLVRFLRAYERRSMVTPASQTHQATVEALEAEVAQLRTAVAHLEQGQDFTAQLLAERSGLKAKISERSNSNSSTDHDAPPPAGTV